MPIWDFCLPTHAFWIVQCTSYFSEMYDNNVSNRIENIMEVFMDDFSVFGDSFELCLSNLDRVLKRCEKANLILNWEKCHFMVEEGIVLGHKILSVGI